MRLISKGPEPNKLTEYRSKGERYDNGMDPEYREPIVTQLLTEQDYRCAYCGANLERRKMKIEHWATRALHPDRDLDYTNLLAVCYGDIFCTTNLHCDRSREEITDLIIDPQRSEHIEQLYFANNGTLSSDNPDLFFDIDDTKRLNLNCQQLVLLRRRILNDFRNGLRRIQKRGKPVRFSQLLDQQLSSRNGFNDIIIDYLRKKTQR